MAGQRCAEGIIRRATTADAAAIAGLHVAAWRWAYRGLLPDEYLDGMAASIPRRAARWRERLSHPDPEERTWLVEREGGLAGFAGTGPARDGDADPGSAELYAIYLAEPEAGRGLGRELLAHALDDLRRRGYAAATLWVLAGNARARRFYEAFGWRPDGATKTEEGPGLVLEEIRYRIDLDGDASAVRGRGGRR